MVRQDKKTGALLILAVFLSAVLLCAAAWCVLFGYNRFSLELELLGPRAAAVEYGEDYAEPGFRVVLRGTRFWTEGVEIAPPVAIDGYVDRNVVGKYSLQYRASFLGMEASEARVVRIVDTRCPVITLVPDPEDLQAEPVYREAGFSAFDNYDGDITDRVRRSEEIDRIIYTVVDSSGNPASVVREIPIYDDMPPRLTLCGAETVTVTLGTPFQDPGCTAVDRKDGDLTDRIVSNVDREISRHIPDVYTITYSVTDSDGNTSEARRFLNVVPCTPPGVIDPGRKVIYLTFDDGPGPDTARLLNVLKQYQVRATFFVTDTGYPELLRRIVNEGHSIGVHTRTHRYDSIYADVDSYFEDVFSMQQIIYEATGAESWLLRFPGGSSNTVSRRSRGIMTRLTAAVEAAGFTYFDWNVDSGDAGGAGTANAVFRNVTDGISGKDISVVLQHDIHSFSVDAVERIICWGLDNGYRFLPLQADSPVIHHEVQN